MTLRLQLERMPQFGGGNEPKDRQIRDAFRTAERNFQKLRALIERAIQTGDLIGEGTVTEDMLDAAAKALVGDVTGTVGSSGSTTVARIQGTTIAAPAAGDDNKLVQYDHGGTQFVYATVAEVLDVLSTTQGAIIYRNASGWVVLTPGTAGQFLKTNGAGANPAWDDAGGSPPTDFDLLTDGVSSLIFAGGDVVWVT